MVDYTKCTGGTCPLKESCYRYTSKADEWQSWFTTVHYVAGGCIYYLK